MAKTWFQHQRQHWIRDHIHAYGCVSTHALSAYFSISPKLARKDLETFAQSSNDIKFETKSQAGVHAVISGGKTGARVPKHWATLKGIAPVVDQWDIWLTPHALRIV